MANGAYLRYPHLHGDLLAFVADDDVWLAPTDGGRAWRFTADRVPVSHPRFSSDGTRIAWTSTREGEPEVFAADLEGGEGERLTHWGNAMTGVRGWTEDGGDLWEVLGRLEAAGCSRYVVTDVTKDGTLRGPNVELLAEVAQRAKAPVVASGGISSLDDLRALRALVPQGVDSAIVGKALYAGAFTLPEALEVAGGP